MERLDDLIDRYWDIAYTEGASGKSLGSKAGEVLSGIRSEITNLRSKLTELEQQNAMLLEALQTFIDEHEECEDADGWMAFMCGPEAFHVADEVIEAVKGGA